MGILVSDNLCIRELCKNKLDCLNKINFRVNLFSRMPVLELFVTTWWEGHVTLWVSSIHYKSPSCQMWWSQALCKKRLDYEIGQMWWTNWWTKFLYTKISEILCRFRKSMLISLIRSCLVCILHRITGMSWI